MSVIKDTTGVNISDGSALTTVANLMPLPVGSLFAGAGAILEADVKRTEIASAFKSQIAGFLNVKTSDVTTEFVDQHIDQLPAWLKREWNDTSDVVGKTSNFVAGAVAGLAGMAVGGLMFPGLWLASVPAGFALGWFGSDLVVKEFRNAKGDVGGLSALNLSKVMKQMTAEGSTPDPTLTATLMLITKNPKDNTEELEEWVQKHIEMKQADPKAATDLEGYVYSERGALVELLGAETQAKYPPGTNVQDIVASYVRAPHDVDVLMFKPDAFYQAIAEDVSKQHIAQVQAKLQAKLHGKALMNSNADMANAPPPSPAPMRGHQVP